MTDNLTCMITSQDNPQIRALPTPATGWPLQSRRANLIAGFSTNIKKARRVSCEPVNIQPERRAKKALQLLDHLLHGCLMYKTITHTDSRRMRTEALAIQILHLMTHFSQLLCHIPATEITAAGAITDSDHRFTAHQNQSFLASARSFLPGRRPRELCGLRGELGSEKRCQVLNLESSPLQFLIILLTRE